MQAVRHGTILPSLQQNEIGTSELDPFRSSILARGLPCERFTSALAGRRASLGVGADGFLTPWGTFTSYSLPAFLAHSATGQSRHF
jgi:hypothetical protein